MVHVRVMFAINIPRIKKRELFLYINDEATLGRLIELITDKYDKGFKRRVIDPETGEFSVGVIINGIGVRKLDTQLNEGDTVVFFIPRAGG